MPFLFITEAHGNDAENKRYREQEPANDQRTGYTGENEADDACDKRDNSKNIALG